jgi:hypothetical protein
MLSITWNINTDSKLYATWVNTDDNDTPESLPKVRTRNTRKMLRKDGKLAWLPRLLLLPL